MITFLSLTVWNSVISVGTAIIIDLMAYMGLVAAGAVLDKNETKE